MDYPIKVVKDDNDTYLITFPDFPEAHTFSDNELGVFARARDALATIVDAYVKDRRGIPVPSAKGRLRVRVPVLTEAKIKLYEEMRAAGVNKNQLAKRLNVHPPQVDRLLAMTHGSTMQQIEAAFNALGKSLSLQVEEAPKTRRKIA